MPGSLVDAITDWYDHHRRDLPWRGADRTPWGVLVSEVMLQQTQVARVLPAWLAWMQRWPLPEALASEAPGEAVRQWDRLGYPRRALGLHAAAGVMVERHGGQVPRSEAELRAMPGVGEYTAAAVRAFAFAERSVVLDTNVRRVLGRLLGAVERPGPSITAAERVRAERLVPAEGAAAARWSVAVMELGALVCTSAEPRCAVCPVRPCCAWLGAGRPPYAGPARRAQRFAGTDRQVRGRLLAVMRAEAGPVTGTALEAAWPHALQRGRALDSLVADGLVELVGDDRFGLPSRGDPSAQG